MTRRRLLLALGFALAVLAVAWLMPRGPHIDQAHFNRINPGLRLDEVEAILGGPPGYYIEGRPSYHIILHPSLANDHRQSWIDHRSAGRISVDFDNGVVCGKEFNPGLRPGWSLIDRVLAYLRSRLR